MTMLALSRFGLRRDFAPTRSEVTGLAAVVVLLLVVALVAFAGFPTGERSPAALVSDGARLATRADVADVEVLVTVKAGELVAVVAYEGEKGWLGIDLEPVPAGTAAAWAATDGDGPVPALSMVYGRATGDRVSVAWADGRSSAVTPERDGSYVAAREGRQSVEKVIVFDGEQVVLEVTDL